MQTRQIEQEMAAYVEGARPQLQASLDAQLREGADISELIGLIGDGTGVLAPFGQVVLALPRAAVEPVIAILRQDPALAEMLGQLEHPPIGSFPMVVAYQGNIGLSWLGCQAIIGPAGQA